MSCDICGNIPHNPRCPYYSSAVNEKCFLCKDEIQIGEEYIESHNGNLAHVECCSLFGISETLEFLDVEVRTMEEL